MTLTLCWLMIFEILFQNLEGDLLYSDSTYCLQARIQFMRYFFKTLYVMFCTWNTCLPYTKSTWLKLSIFVTATTFPLSFSTSNGIFCKQKSKELNFISHESNKQMCYTSFCTIRSFVPYKIWIFVFTLVKLYSGGCGLPYNFIFFSLP